nr:ribonuclease H-like domain-containing protein [uncultured Desulfobacter sp.]
MLTNSFQHIPGIGAATEAQLWASGLLDWERIEPENTLNIPPKRFETIAAHTKTALGHLENKNPTYFSDRLPAKEHWRLFHEFRDATAYIDIETTGISAYGFEITTIALYDGKDIRYYVDGRNLEQFIEDIQDYKVLVTYNGKTFDVPFIEGQFGIQLNHAHIDLRYVLKSLGYSGGLKQCEKALGLDRGDLDGVDGYFAVLLWHEYQKNNNGKALETLLAYNIEDVVNLETLMVTAYNMKLKETPFNGTHTLPLPNIPEIPFKPDLETIDRIKAMMTGSFGG